VSRITFSTVLVRVGVLAALVASWFIPLTYLPATAHALTVPQATQAAAKISAGYAHSLAVTSAGTVVAWGSNDSGQAVVPSGLSGVIAVAAGGSHSLALTSAGTVVVWGANDSAQATVPPGLSGVIAVAAGGEHSLALRSNGTVVAWGANDSRQSSVPAGLSGVVAVAAGDKHSLALRSNGTVVAWGDNRHGQSSVPSNLVGIVSVACGHSHSLALRSNGTVIAWGLSENGQTSVPSTLSGVVAIDGGARYSLALTESGTVFAWGGRWRNPHTGVTQTDPAAIVPAALGPVNAVAAGAMHSLALRSDATRVGWGDNSSAQAFGLVSADPPTLTRNVPLDTVFSLTFSSHIHSGPRFTDVVLRNRSGVPVSITVSLAGDTLTVDPVRPLLTDEIYTLSVPVGSITDTFGLRHFGTLFDYHTPDTLAPLVVSSTPANGANAVRPDTPVILSFNEMIVQGANFNVITLSTAQGDRIDCRVDLHSEGRVVVLPRAQLDPRTSYTLNLPQGAVNDMSGNVFAAAHTMSFTTGVRVVRIAGTDRVRTAIEISKSGFTTAPTVVLATSQNFPDALAAAPLARALGAPILLVPATTSLPAHLMAEITRLGATRAVIVGGTGVVSAGVAGQLSNAGITVTRIAGENRYDTAARIALELARVRGVSGFATAYVATGENFPDALAAGGVAAARGVPVLLTRRDTLPAQTSGALSTLGVTETIVLGGTGVITEEVEALLTSPVRIAGINRYATGIAVVEHALASAGFTTSAVYIATGRNYPDALAAGAVIAAARHPLVLVPDTIPVPSVVTGFLGSRFSTINQLNVLGGTGPVPEVVATELRLAAQ